MSSRQLHTAAALPDGTVTFAFLDIEGSTELLQQVGADYSRLLATYRDLTERAVVEHSGVMVGSEGDGLFVAFAAADDAVRSAIQVQRAFSTTSWPGDAVVRARMGIHTGTPTLIGNDYTGIDVHRAARIMAAAWGGQVLVSQPTVSLLGDSELDFQDLGWFMMKGLSRPERLYQLLSGGLDPAFPPPRARRREVDVPVQLTSLIGRDGDVAAVIGLLESGARLVTLTGPGGIGKSRIALAVAERLDARYADGVSFVGLSDETAPERVPVAIADAFGLSGEGAGSAVEAVVNHVAPLEVLLVLDGFERVTSAGATIAEILGRCPRVTALVTSRAGLRIGVEREYRVEALDVAESGAPIERIGASAAVQLFLDRARRVQPAMELTSENAGTILELVGRLDGVPLSIELAAARARLLPPQAILERLGAVLGLTASATDLPTRQRSLRATIEWSHGLLGDAERTVIRRLGVFRDGWDLEAAEKIAEGEGVDVFVGLDTLATQSLITVDAGGRMGMGTAMREYAVEQLVATGEEAEIRLRHARHYAALAQTNEPLLRGRRQSELIVRLSRDWPNLRSAVEWALNHDHLPLAASIYAGTWLLAWYSNHFLESEGYTDRFVAIVDRLDDPLRARVLFVAAGMYVEMGDARRALPHARRAVELAVRVGDQLTEAWARIVMTAAMLGHDVVDPEARRQVDEAAAVARSMEDPMTLAYAVSFQGTLATLDGDLEAAFSYHRESLELARRLDHVPVMVQAFSQIAAAHLVSGDPVAARICLEKGVDLLDQVRSAEALALFLDSAALLAFAENDRVRALTALGAADTARARAGLARWAAMEALLQEAGMAAESEQPALVDARRAGTEMSPMDAIVFSLQRHHELAPAT